MSEHDEGLALSEWALLVPTAAIWMVNGLAGFLLFCMFVGYIAYRQNPAAFVGLISFEKRPALPRSGNQTAPDTRDEDAAHLRQLLTAPMNQQESRQSAAPAQTRTVPWRQWRVQAVHAHHLLIIGNTDSGKTTLVRALLTGKRGAILVIDPKNRPGKWGGIAAIGLDDNAEYVQIDQALQMVLAELRRRQKALNQGASDFDPFTVVVDEAPDVADECTAFPTLFKRVGSVGRELRMSLIVLSQRSTVRPLGIVGDGQARDNFTKILMGSFARRSVPALAGQRYCAVLETDGDYQVLDVAPLPVYARLPIKAGVVSSFATRDTNLDTSPPGMDTRYVPGMDMEVGIEPDTRANKFTDHDTRYGAGVDTRGHTTHDDEPSDDQIRQWFADGMSKRKIKEQLRGTQQQRQERINRALEQMGDSDDETPTAFGFLGT